MRTDRLQDIVKDFFLVFLMLGTLLVLIFVKLTVALRIIGGVYTFTCIIIGLWVINNLITSFFNWRRIKNEMKNIAQDADSAVIIAGMDCLSLRDIWVSPYSFNFKDFFKWLKLTNVKYKVFANISLNKFDEIIQDNKFKNIYLFGHGKRHAFVLNKNDAIYYCRYANKNIKKKYIAQFHCNHGGGYSLADYVVDKKNKKKCDITKTYTNIIYLNKEIRENYKQELKKHGKRRR